MSRNTRLAGHTLPREGRVCIDGRFVSKAATRCSCGEWSPVLPSDSARKRWHRDHKLAVKGELCGAGGEHTWGPVEQHGSGRTATACVECGTKPKDDE